jgi:hypothetical protein
MLFFFYVAQSIVRKKERILRKEEVFRQPFMAVAGTLCGAALRLYISLVSKLSVYVSIFYLSERRPPDCAEKAAAV